jgi:hypothetical protein
MAFHTTEMYQAKLGLKRPDVACVGTYVSSSRKLLHECNKCGHQWSATPIRVLHERLKCPACKKADRVANYKQRLQNELPTVICLGEYEYSQIHLEHKCTECGKQWMIRPDSLLNEGHVCKLH